jgi:hypothetical protein
MAVVVLDLGGKAFEPGEVLFQGEDVGSGMLGLVGGEELGGLAGAELEHFGGLDEEEGFEVEERERGTSGGGLGEEVGRLIAGAGHAVLEGDEGAEVVAAGAKAREKEEHEDQQGERDREREGEGGRLEWDNDDRNEQSQ